MLIPFNKFFILIFSFFISYHVLGQGEILLDSSLSLGELYENTGNYNAALEIYKEQLLKKLTLKEEALYLSKIGSAHYKTKEYQKSKSFYYRAVQKDTASSSLVKNYIGLSYCYKKLKHKDSSIYYVEKANSKNQSLTKSYEQVDSEYKIAFVYSYYGYDQEAISLLLSASNGFKQFPDKKKLANIYNEVAFINRSQGNVKTSLEYYHKAKHLRQEIQDFKGLSAAYNNLGNGHKSLKQLDSALFYYKSSLKIKEEKNYNNQGFTLHNIGTVFYLKGDLPTANAYYKKALSAKKEMNDTATLAYSYNELALIAIESNDLKLGEAYLDSSYVYIQGISELVLRIYELQEKLYEKKGNYHKAYQYQKRYINAYKELYNSQKSKTIIDNQEKYENVKRTKKIENLTEENKLTTEILTKRTIYLIGAIILSLLLLVMYFISKQRQKLFAQKEDFKNLRKLFKSQDIVRNKIGRDLHDIVKSKYEGIRLMIISLHGSSNLKNDIKEITQEIIEANEQVRLLSHRLSPLDQRIRHSTLTQIIRAELNKFQMYNNINVSIIEDFPEEWNSIKLEKQNHLYGIFLEAIHNIKEHSNASEIVINSAISNKKYFRINISDNGIGAGSVLKEGIGIGNMRSRAKLMNGNLNIISDTTGFSIILEFPLNTNTNDEM